MWSLENSGKRRTFTSEIPRLWKFPLSVSYVLCFGQMMLHAQLMILQESFFCDFAASTTPKICRKQDIRESCACKAQLLEGNSSTIVFL